MGDHTWDFHDECGSITGIRKMTPDEKLLNDAIHHADIVAKDNQGSPCGLEHTRLALWLRELRLRRINDDRSS